MKRLILVGVLAALAVTLAVAGATAAGNATGNSGGGGPKDTLRGGITDLPSPLGQKQRELVKEAVQQKLRGKIAKDAKVAKVGKRQGCARAARRTRSTSAKFVELERTGEDTIWTVLMEFGTAQATHNHGTLGSSSTTAAPRPAAQPDPAARPRRRQHDDLGARLQQGLLRRTCCSPRRRASARCGTSTSRTRPAGTPSTARSRTGSSAVQRGRLRLELLRQHRLRPRHPAPARGRAERLVHRAARGRQDGRADQHVPGPVRHVGPLRLRRRRQLQRAGRLHRPLPGDPRRRGRGDRRRRPGHRRHLEPSLVHEHRPGSARSGPTCNPLGGVRIGNSNYWVGDYTVEPENGGVGVFAHEFGHDLGIPDEYDTSGNTGGAENSTGFWTTWSSGSYGSDGTPAERDRQPAVLDERLGQAGLRLARLPARQPGDGKTEDHARPVEAQSSPASRPRSSTCRTGSCPRPRRAVRGLEVLLLEHRRRPRQPDVQVGHAPGGTRRFSAKARYNIEPTGTTPTWSSRRTAAPTTRPSRRTSRRTRARTARTSATASPACRPAQWVDLTATCRPMPARPSIGFEYWTDGAQAGRRRLRRGPGISLDDIAITGQPLDGAETDTGWTFDPAAGGFNVTTGTETHGRTSTRTSSRTASTSARTSSASASTDRSAPRRTTSAARSARTGPSASRTRTACSLVLEHAVQQQQRRRPPGRGRDPSRRRPPADHALGRRQRRSRPDPVVRLDVRRQEDRRDHAAQGRRARRRSSRSRACRSSTTCRAGGRRPTRATPSATTRPPGPASTSRRPAPRCRSRATTKKD